MAGSTSTRETKRARLLTGMSIPPAELLKLIGAVPGDYLPGGQHLFRIFKASTRLRRSHRVLDVGCGCGRVAWHLSKFLTHGSYDGFDVVPELVGWCRANITPQHPNFRFEHVDVANRYYHARGGLPARQFRFPYADGSFHRILLTSVFTHMMPDDFRNYSAEIARTLKPGGAAMMSFFMLNDESRRSLYRPGTRPKFWHRRGQLMITRRDDAERAVAYPEAMVRAVLHESGLELQQVLFGSWCGREQAVSCQDIVIARRKRQRGHWQEAAVAVRDTAMRFTGWLRR